MKKERMEMPLLNVMAMELENEGVTLAIKFGSDPIREIKKLDLDPDSEFVHRSRKRLSQTFIYEPCYNKKVYEGDNIVCRIWHTERNEEGRAEWLLYVYQGEYKTFLRTYEQKKKRRIHTIVCDWLKVDLEEKLLAVHDYFDMVEEVNDLFRPKKRTNDLYINLQKVNDRYDVWFELDSEKGDDDLGCEKGKSYWSSGIVPKEEQEDGVAYYKCDCSVLDNYKYLIPYMLLGKIIWLFRQHWIDKMAEKRKMKVSSVYIRLWGTEFKQMSRFLSTSKGKECKAFSIRQCHDRVDDFTQFMGWNYGAPVIVSQYDWKRKEEK